MPATLPPRPRHPAARRPGAARGLAGDPASHSWRPRSSCSRRSAPTSCTRDNAFEVLRLSVEIGLLAVALTPVIVSGGIDLSVGSLMGLSAVLFGKLWRDARAADRASRRC